MNSKQFLLSCGIFLITLGTLGYVGVFGPYPEQSILGNSFWLDGTENFIHTLLGFAAVLIYYYLHNSRFSKWLVIGVGITAAVAAVYGITNANVTAPNVAGVTNFENPSETILHAIIALWAFYVAFVDGITEAQ